MKARGFSLIELVVVMVIAAILAALAIPRFTDSESKATWYHEQVMSAVRFAQRQAVAQRRNVFVCVSGTAVSLGYDAGCTGAIAQTGAVLQIPQTLSAPGSVTVTATTTPFSFNGLGQPSPIGGVGLSLTGHSITVTAETGYVFGN